MVGEVLDRVLGETRGPILITPEPHPASKAGVLERAESGGQEGPAVLVATDGSEVSLRAGKYAARLAHGLGAKLFALYVVDEHLTFRSGVHYGEFVERLLGMAGRRRARCGRWRRGSAWSARSSSSWAVPRRRSSPWPRR